MKPILTSATVRDLLSYDRASGAFTWRVSCGSVKAGSVAGAANSRGYRKIRIGGNFYLEHRLAWLHVYGEWPGGEIDHVNQLKGDNRIENLRDVTHSENMHNRPSYANNKSGYRGVSWNNQMGLWRAEISINKKRTHIGYFSTAECAHAAYQTARVAMEAQPASLPAPRKRGR